MLKRRAQLSSDQAEGKIWTVEVSTSREQRESAQSRRDREPSDLTQITDSRQIWKKVHVS
jgi:hypothetical protein